MKDWHRAVLCVVGMLVAAPPVIALGFWWMIVCMTWAIK